MSEVKVSDALEILEEIKRKLAEVVTRIPLLATYYAVLSSKSENELLHLIRTIDIPGFNELKASLSVYINIDALVPLEEQLYIYDLLLKLKSCV